MSAPTMAQPRRSARALADPDAQARRLAEAVDRTWRAGYGHLSHDIPLSVIAALSLMRHPDQQPTATTPLLGLDPVAMTGLLRQVWTTAGILRPDLTPRFEALAGWLGRDPTTDQQRAAHAVATTALRAGLGDLSADLDQRRAVDLLGLVLQLLRGPTHTDRGQVYSSSSLARLLARLVLADATPGQWICDPTAGTGGMLRAAAEALCQRGVDPASMGWAGCDVDPLAAGCLAVNAHLWGLGPQVLIGCGDILLGDWETTALAERAEAIRRFRTYRLVATALALEARPAGRSTPPVDRAPHPAARPTAAAGRRIPRRSPLAQPETLP